MGMHNLMYEEKYLKLRGEEGEEMFGDIVDVHLDEGIIQFQGQSGVSSEWSVDDTDGDCSDHSVPRRRSRLSTSFGIEAEVGDDDDTIDATSSSSSSSTMAGLEPKLPPAVRKSLEKRLERILEQRAESTASSSYESVTESESEEGNDRTEDEAVSTPSKAAGCDCFSSGIGRLDLCVRTAFLQEIFVRFFHGYKQVRCRIKVVFIFYTSCMANDGTNSFFNRSPLLRGTKCCLLFPLFVFELAVHIIPPQIS